MHRWLFLTGALLSTSCLAYDAQADAAAPDVRDPGGAGGGAEEVGSAAAALLDDPCNRACAAAAYTGCGYVTHECAGAGSMADAVSLDACALPCDAALPAGCGGMIGLQICVSDCSR